jgi:putative oxidoreductase
MNDNVERRGAPLQSVALLVARVLLAAIFLQSGFGKLIAVEAFSGYLSSNGVPGEYAYAAAVTGAVVEFLGALCILFGFLTRLAALVMALFTAAAAGIGHRFWDVADPTLHSTQMTHFMKNLAIIGGFLALYATGPGRVSVDWRAK